MPAGKLASQAGHAFLGSFLQAQHITPAAAQEYCADGPGTKVVLGSSLEGILHAQELCVLAGIPHALVTDSGHVLPPHFDGSSIITALGIGPVTRAQVKHITKHYQLYKEAA